MHFPDGETEARRLAFVCAEPQSPRVAVAPHFAGLRQGFAASRQLLFYVSIAPRRGTETVSLRLRKGLCTESGVPTQGGARGFRESSNPRLHLRMFLVYVDSVHDVFICFLKVPRHPAPPKVMSPS